MAERKVQVVTTIKAILVVSLVVSLALIAHYYPTTFIKFVVFAVLALWVLSAAQ